MKGLTTLYLSVYNSLEFNTPYEKSDILNSLLKLTSEYTKTYMSIAFEKCVVNNVSRIKLGCILDLFYKKDNKYYKYSKETYCGEYYSFDKEACKQDRIDKKLRDIENRGSFLSDYTPYTGNYTISNKIAIICGCSKEKLFTNYKVPAYQRYLGKEISIIKSLKLNYKFDLYIISAKYGLISADSLVDYYDKSFNELTVNDIYNIKDDLKIRQQFEKLLSEYKAIFLCLGDKYMRTLNLKIPFTTDCNIINIELSKYKGTRLQLKNTKRSISKLEIPFSDLNNSNCSTLTAKGNLIKNIFTTLSEEDIINDYEKLQNIKVNYKKQTNHLFEVV